MRSKPPRHLVLTEKLFGGIRSYNTLNAKGASVTADLCISERR